MAFQTVRTGCVLSQAAFLVMILSMLTTTVPVLQHLTRDTRAEAKTWCAQALAQHLKCHELVVKNPKDIDLDAFRKAGVTHVLLTSDLYERYLFVKRLKNQPQRVYQIISRIDSLFQYPYRDIRPAFKSFAFSNPTVRIVDIRLRRKTGEPPLTRPGPLPRSVPGK